jgi:acyl-coenzyme A synthetase/AMP-(fatty) acid ligase
MKRGYVSGDRHLYNITEDCVLRPASEDRSQTALIFADERGASRKWTRAELARAVQGVAAWLRKSGVKKGQRLLIRLPNGTEFPAAFFGAILAGAIPIPASPLLTPSEVRFLTQDSGAVCVLDDPERLRRLMETPHDRRISAKSRANDPAFWLYTSGTEGKPKGVIHAHRSIPAHDARCRLWMDLRPGDVVFNTSALNWSYALTCGLADTLRHRAISLIFSGRPDPETLLKVIARERVTILMSVPGILRRLTDYLERRQSARKLLASVRICISAGEKLPLGMRSRFRKVSGRTLVEGLGMTEHSVYLVQPKGFPIVEGSCGRSLAGRKVTILREDLRPARPGEVGILASHRSCAGLMLGYHRRPKEEKKVFRQGWFLSGDFATRDEKGNFFYVGRRDDVITAGGYRISPMEVEAVLNRHPAVRESAAVGAEIALGKTIVRGHVVLKRGRRATEALKNSILDFARKRLARYKAPREVAVTAELPRTSTGKLIRKKFRSL